MTWEMHPTPEAGGAYVRAASWPCVVVLATSAGLLSIERQFIVHPRLGTVDPYDMALEFLPLDPPTFATGDLPYDTNVLRWDMYRTSDLRWLHGNAFENLWTGSSDITIVFPSFEGHLA